MTITSTITRQSPSHSPAQSAGTTAPGQTFWPTEPVALVPNQAGPDHARRPAAQGPMPSLRELGVRHDDLTPRRESVRTQVLRCSSSALCAAQHLLEQAAPEARALTQVVESDPVLTLRVLHLANQSVRHHYQADTVPQAIRVLGTETLGSLVNELLMEATLGAMGNLWRVLARALTCEELSGDRIGFTAGLLSGLADELGAPPALVLDVAGVSRDVSDAVRFGTGPWGPVVTAVVAYERNDAMGVARSGIAPVEVYDAYLRGATDAMATAQAIGSS